MRRLAISIAFCVGFAVAAPSACYAQTNKSQESRGSNFDERLHFLNAIIANPRSRASLRRAFIINRALLFAEHANYDEAVQSFKEVCDPISMKKYDSLRDDDDAADDQYDEGRIVSNTELFLKYAAIQMVRGKYSEALKLLDLAEVMVKTRKTLYEKCIASDRAVVKVLMELNSSNSESSVAPSSAPSEKTTKDLVDPYSTEFLAELCCGLCREGKEDEAKRIMKLVMLLESKVLSRFNTCTLVYLAKANCLLKETEKAKELLGKCVELDSMVYGNKSLELARDWRLLSELYRQEKSLDRWQECLQKVYDIVGKNYDKLLLSRYPQTHTTAAPNEKSCEQFMDNCCAIP